MTTLEDIHSLLSGAQAATADSEMPIVDGPAAVETEIPPPPVRRGRGRPRKVAAPAAPAPETGRTGQPVPKSNAIAEAVSVSMSDDERTALTAAIEKAYVLGGMGLSPFRPMTGAAIGNAAEDCAKAWVAAAETNPAIKRALMSLVKTSTVGALVAVHIPIVLAAAQEGRAIKQSRSEDAGQEGSDHQAYPAPRPNLFPVR